MGTSHLCDLPGVGAGAGEGSRVGEMGRQAGEQSRQGLTVSSAEALYQLEGAL